MQQELARNTVQINGISCSYTHGGTGQTLLLLHGWAQSARTWQKVAPALSKKYSVYCLDLPGFGLSDSPPKPWTIRDYADFVHDFVNALSLDSTIVVGHSFGARVAADYASRYPLEKLVLCASAGATRTAFRSINALLVHIVGAIAPASLLRAHASYLTPRGYADIRRMDTKRARLMLDTYLQTHADTEPFPQNTCPALIIHGGRDYIAPASAAKLLHRHIPNSTLILFPESGHFPHIDGAETFAAKIHAFIG